MKIRNLLNVAIIRIFFGVLMLGSVGVSGQDCYVNLSDISGIEHSNYQSEIEEAACELRDSLPADFQNDFKVYDAGFYSHIESYRNYNYLDAFNDIKNDITTTYYLYVGKQNDSKGVYTKFFVDINLADVVSNGCVPDFNEKASKLIEYVINENYNRTSKTPSSYPNALIKGIKALNNYLSNVKSCCQQGGDVAQCLECNNPNNIAAKLMAEGFNSVSIKNIGSWDTGSQDIPEVTDYANQLFTVGDGLTGINIPQSYLNVIPEYEERGLSVKIFITKDENICDGIWQNVKEEIENSDEDVIFWHHIYKGDFDFGDEKLFTKVFVKNFKNEERKLEIDNRFIDPLSTLLRMAASAASDALMQSIMIYFTNDDIETGDWGEAWSRVNYGSVIWSGFQGLFPVNSKLARVLKAAASATAEVTYNAIHDDNYSINQAMSDFSVNFLLEIIFGGSGSSISKNSSLKNNLKSAKLTKFSKKTLEKMRNLFGDGKSAQKMLTGFVYELENMNLISPRIRGLILEDWVGVWKYAKLGYKQTAHSFKGIDFHNAAEKIGVSMKTVKENSKSALRNNVSKKHIEILSKAVNKAEKICHSSKSTKCLPVKKIKILVVIEDGTKLSEMQTYLDQIMQGYKQGGMNIANLTWEVTTMKKMLNF